MPPGGSLEAINIFTNKGSIYISPPLIFLTVSVGCGCHRVHVYPDKGKSSMQGRWSKSGLVGELDAGCLHLHSLDSGQGSPVATNNYLSPVYQGDQTASSGGTVGMRL